jgi:glycosyltransferase involved in cell wall biosynthesis
VDKNLLIITYYFPPLGGVGVQRVSKFSKYLPCFGWHPIVVAPQPSAFYMADVQMLAEVRHVELYRVAGLDSFKMREKLVGPFKPRIDSPLRWIARRLSWPDTQTGYIPAAFRLTYKLRDKAQAIFATAPPYSNLLLARILKRVASLPLIVDMRDPWVGHPEHDKQRWKRALNRRTERDILEHVDAVIAATRAHTDDLKKRYPYLSARIHCIPNGFDAADFTPRNTRNTPTLNTPPRTRNTPAGTRNTPAGKGRSLRKKGALKICYTGILGLETINRGTTLYKAIQRLRDEDGITPAKLRVEIMGEISAVEAERIRRSGVSTFVKPLGYVAHRKAMQRLQKADLAWLPYHSEYSSLIVPAKTYEYIGSGTPVLAVVNPHHETAQLIRETGTGMIVSEGDVDGVTEALRLLLAGRFPYTPKLKTISRFERRYQTGELARILDALTRDA